MHRPCGLGCKTCELPFVEGLILEANTERFDARMVPRRQRRNQSGVNATAQKDADGDIRLEAPSHRFAEACNEFLAPIAFGILRDFFERLDFELPKFVRVQVKIAAGDLHPVAGREFMYAIKESVWSRYKSVSKQFLEPGHAHRLWNQCVSGEGG